MATSNLFIKNQINYIFLLLLICLFFSSCSGLFYDYSQRTINNKVSISNNLNERVNIVCKENGKTSTTYYNPDTKSTEIELMDLKPKHKVLIFSENTDTVELKIKKVPRTRAVIQNALATPFMFGVNWLFEIGNPNYFKVSKSSKEIKITNLRYNHKFIENKFKIAFNKYNRDTILNYLQVYDYYIGLENIKSNIDSIEYNKIKNSTDTNQYNQYHKRALTSKYRNIVYGQIRFFRDVNLFCENNKNTDSRKIKDYLNKIQTSLFSFWVEDLYITKWDHELNSGKLDFNEVVKFLKYTNAISNPQKFTNAAYVISNKPKYAFLISRSIKEKLMKSINENIDYLINVDSLVYSLEKENVLPRNFIDSTKENLRVALLNKIVSDIKKCKNHECQFKTFDLIKNRAHYPPGEKHLDLYIYNNLSNLSNVNDIDLYYPENKVSDLIKELPSKYFETYQFSNIIKQPYRICLSKIKNDKGDFKYYEKRIFNKENILVMKVESLDFKYFDTRNYYFNNKRVVGIQYLYKNETNGSNIKAAEFAIDEKGVVENNKNIIKVIDDYFKDKKSFDSLSLSQLQVYKNQIKEVRLEFDTIWEIPELISVKNYINNLEIKIEKSIAKNEAKEQLLIDQFKNKLTTAIKIEKSIPTAIVQKRLDRVEKNEYGQIVNEYYKYAFIDSRTNNLISEFIYDEIEYIEELNRFYVGINGKYGMANASGKIVIPTIFYKINYENFSSKGFARCCVNRSYYGFYDWDNIIDFSGKIILKNNAKIVIKEWTSINSFIVQIDDKFGVYNTNYKPIVECIYDELIDIEYNYKIRGFKYLGRKKTAYSNTIDIITENNNITKSLNIVNEGKLQGYSSLYWREDNYSVFILNSMIPIFLPMDKMNYYLINNNQYLFDDNQGLYVEEYLDINKTNFQNSNVFILSTTLKSYPDYTKPDDIKLYKNQKVLDLQNLISSCNCKNNTRFQKFNISLNQDRKTIEIDCVKSFEYRECQICLGRKMDYYPLDGSCEFSLSEF